MFRMVKKCMAAAAACAGDGESSGLFGDARQLQKRQMGLPDEFDTETEEGAEVLYTRDSDTWEWQERDAHARAKDEDAATGKFVAVNELDTAMGDERR